MSCRCRFFLPGTPGNRVAQQLDHYEGLTSQWWRGPASRQMAIAFGRYLSWLEETARKADSLYLSIKALVTINEAALNATVPLAEIEEILKELRELQKYPIVNAASIGDVERRYQEMYRKNSNAMIRYMDDAQALSAEVKSISFNQVPKIMTENMNFSSSEDSLGWEHFGGSGAETSGSDVEDDYHFPQAYSDSEEWMAENINNGWAIPLEVEDTSSDNEFGIDARTGA